MVRASYTGGIKMEYQHKIIVSNRTIYKEFGIQSSIEKVKLGTISSCEFRLNPEVFFNDIEIEFQKKQGIWSIECSDGLYFSRGDMRKLMSIELEHGDVISVRYETTGNEAFEIRFLIDFEAKIPNYNWYVDLEDNLEISTDAGADIVIKSQFSSQNNVIISKNGNNYFLEEKVSEYGVYVNGQKISQRTKLSEHDFFSIEEFSFYYKDNKLFFDKNNLLVADDKVKELNVHTNNFKYPLFNRNTRIRKKLSDEKIEILDAPAIPKKPETNIVITLMPSIAMLAVMIIVRGFMSTTGGSYIILSVCSMGLGIVTSILSFFSGRKRYKKDCKERITKYTKYIDEKKIEISTERQLELDSLNETYCDIEQDVDIALHFDRRLFEKIKENEDFLNIYLS